MTSEISITEASLQSALADRLKATHVEVTDMSGMSCDVVLHFRFLWLFS